MSQKGNHTWDIIIDYHRCPSCGYIFESREGYEYYFGKYLKNLECSRCGNLFTVTKKGTKTFGPVFGEGENAEVQWGDR